MKAIVNGIEMPDLADTLEAAVGFLRRGDKHETGLSTYSCTALYMALQANRTTFTKGSLETIAGRMLDSLKPGITVSFTAFSDCFFGEEAQFCRALWLTFLAELAECGDLTWEGLQ